METNSGKRAMNSRMKDTNNNDENWMRERHRHNNAFYAMAKS